MRVWLPTIKAGSGADVFTRRLSTALRTAGIDAIVTWYAHRYEFLPELMRLKARPPHIDVIHANSWNANTFINQGPPVVTTVHHLVHDPAYAPYRTRVQQIYHQWHILRREKNAILRSAAVTTVSAYVAGTVTAFSKRNDISVIHNWVDTDYYIPSPSYHFNPDRPFRLLMVGNQGKRKGSDLLPLLMSKLGANFELRYTGGLRNIHTTQTAHVCALGRLSEEALRREYQECDAVISLSRYEGFGYTALEAMACGKPFLGFNTSGLAEVAQEHAGGFLAPVNDIDALVQQCHRLSALLAQPNVLAEAARQRAVNDFSEQQAIQKYIDVYRYAIESAHKPP